MIAGKIIRKLIQNLQIDRLLFLVTTGTSVHSRIGKLAPVIESYPQNTIRRVRRKGLYYDLDLSDYQQWLIYFGFINDLPEGLFELIKPHFNIIDVGANVGQTSLAFSKLISPSQSIWAFEPNPVNFSKCETNIKLNHIANIYLIQAGLGSYVHTAHMSPETNGNSGGARILEQSETGPLVNITTLDDFMANVPSPVHFIKIDVEGYEHEVLKGAVNLLNTQKPMLYIEIDDQHLRAQNTTPAALIKHVADLGYTLYRTDTREHLHPGIDFSNCHFDACALPSAND